jgi:hypothetical protein
MLRELLIKQQKMQQRVLLVRIAQDVFLHIARKYICFTVRISALSPHEERIIKSREIK